MTGGSRALHRRPRRRRPGIGIHLPSVTGRARNDFWALLLVGCVVAVATLLAAGIPVAMHSTSDRAVADSVSRAGDAANIVVEAPLPTEDLEASGARIRDDGSADLVDQALAEARNGLDRTLGAVMDPPVATVTSVDLTLTDNGPNRALRLAYLTGGTGARVTWTAGRPPQSSVTEAEVATAARSGPAPWPVQVGLSEQTAAVLGVRPGQRLPLETAQFNHLDIRVSGIFRPVDPGDVAWRSVPHVLQPRTGVRTDAVALLSRDSLPDGRLALDEEATRCAVTFSPRPDRLTRDDAATVELAALAMKASSADASQAATLRYDTQLDGVLHRARTAVAAASSQALVLLAGLIVSAALLLVLAADVLVRRRSAVIVGTRMRGASLTSLAIELVLESAAVTFLGAGCGVAGSWLLTGGASRTWPVPVVVVSVLAGPVLGTMVAARATDGRRAPANRSARRAAVRTRAQRRLVLEVGIAAAAVAAFVSLRQRGVVPADAGGGSGVLPALTPALGAAVGALVLIRLVPVVVRLWLRRATRSRRTVPLLAASRAAVTAARGLPLTVLAVCSALLAVALAMPATESAGQADGAWAEVGADARMDLASPADPAQVQALVGRLTGSAGIRQVLAARVADVPVTSGSTTGVVRLVVVDAAALRRLLARTPLPDAPQLSRLVGAPGRALLRSANRGLASGGPLSLLSGSRAISLTAIGTAPRVGVGGDGARDVLVVDAATFAAAGGDAVPNTVWVLGPGAASAVSGSSAPVTLRRDVLGTRRSAPLAAGLIRLGYLSTGLLLLLGALGVLLTVITGRPSRDETLARLSTLGLRRGEIRRVAAGELLPVVVLATTGGLAVGLVLAWACIGLLGLRLVTGQVSDPALVVPWTGAAPPLVFAVVVMVVVGAESARRRRQRLGLVLRAGNA